jgi:elongation factor Ts
MSVEQVKKLRERTGCPFMDAKRALQEAGGDLDRAVEVVRHWFRCRPGGRPAQAGAVFQDLYQDGSAGGMVVLHCLSDLVARSPLFRELGGALARQVAAMGPAGVEELLELPFLKDPSKTVRQMVAEVAARSGEGVQVREVCRCKV